MVKRSSASQAPRSANLSPADIKAAIPKLQRRIAELKAVDVSTIMQQGDPRLVALNSKIDDTLIQVFGPDTVEYLRYRIGSLGNTWISFMYETPISEVRKGYQDGIEQAVSQLQAIVDLFTERLDDLGETPVARALTALLNLDLHPEVGRAVSDLYSNRHYSNAVEDACKVLDALVKMRSGKHDLSGTDLMLNVFSPNKPVLKFGDLATESGKSEQQGMMYLYAGAMLAFRNPRAHGIIEDNPEKALDLIAFISFLAKSLDKAFRT